LAESASLLTQVPLQARVGGVHPCTHIDLLHILPRAQTEPHEPQLDGSVAVFVQTPPQVWFG